MDDHACPLAELASEALVGRLASVCAFVFRADWCARLGYDAARRAAWYDAALIAPRGVTRRCRARSVALSRQCTADNTATHHTLSRWRAMNRREFVAASAGMLVGPSWSPLLKPQQARRTRLILLGTGGGPRPRTNRVASAQVIIVNNSAYVVDCGDGVARQLVAVGVPLTQVRHILVTHHHSDHNADYGNLILGAWTVGLERRLDTWGPPPLEKITRLFFEMNAYDINMRVADEGKPSLAPLVRAHELTTSGPVFNDETVKVTTVVVPHPPVEPAFAFRFDTTDRSIVISGDTAPSDNLIQLARGADVLVHEAMYLPAIDRLVARVPNATRLKQHILASHTAAEDAGRVAQAAGAKLLVLSHLIPADDPTITDEMWIKAARVHFRGPVIVGKDLLEI
jgi:ribonuclease BN (tRNA processing enzyme)